MSTELSFKDLLQQFSDKFKEVSDSWDEIVNKYTKTNHTKAITLQDWNTVVALLGRTDAYVRGMFPVVEGFGELGDAFSAEVQSMQLDAENAAEDAKAVALDVRTIADTLKSKTIESVTLTDDFRIKFVFSDGNELVTDSVQGPEGPEGPAGGISIETLIEHVQEALAEAKDYTDEELATFDFIKVESNLPEKGLPNKIYLVPKPDAQTQDLFDEYVWADGKWEWITTKQIEVDLTPYVKKENGKGLSTNDLTDSLKAKYDTAYNYSQSDHGYVKTADLKSLVLDMIYPIGAIYMSVYSTSPAAFIGGSWTRLEDRFLIGASTKYMNGSKGGEATHTLTVDEMPSHTHQIRGWAVNVGSGTSQYSPTMPDDNNYNNYLGYAMETGGGQAHNNMPPYLAVYMWKRTA